MLTTPDLGQSTDLLSEVGQAARTNGEQREYDENHQGGPDLRVE